MPIFFDEMYYTVLFFRLMRKRSRKIFLQVWPNFEFLAIHSLLFSYRMSNFPNLALRRWLVAVAALRLLSGTFISVSISLIQLGSRPSLAFIEWAVEVSIVLVLSVSGSVRCRKIGRSLV